jgi:ribosomal protein L16 Arg81 hydroxylase
MFRRLPILLTASKICDQSNHCIYPVSMCDNSYSGCRLLKHIHVLANDTNLSPKSFFRKYISTRTPVLINGQLSDLEWKVKDKWTNNYFREKVPKEEELKIEFRKADVDSFGKGNEKKMSFHHFLDRIDQRKDENLYLTTQDLEYDEEGQPYIMTSPLNYLRDDFPLVPKMFQKLIVSNINLWYGLSTKPTTSGLHHDYHDNLYILLKGTKTITLYSPADASLLYTVGTITKVHSNGRINYTGEETYADGRDLKADKALKASLHLEELMSKIKDKEEPREKGLKVCEDSDDEIDAALDDILDAEMEDDYEDDDCDEEDDHIEVEFNEGEEGECCDENNDEGSNLLTKRKHDGSQPPSKQQKKGPPSNFSLVDTSLPMDEIRMKFPSFPDAYGRSCTVTVKEGQMLYIPAGWFHEVLSQGEEGHIAFNYWFHPPDTKDFTQPYESNFWSKLWQSQKKLPCRPVN